MMLYMRLILFAHSVSALAVLLDFLLQVTAFVALLIFDFLRAEDRGVDCFPCIRVSSSDEDSDKGNCHVYNLWLIDALS